MLEELLHDRVRRAVALDLDHDPHAVPVAFVANVANIGDLLGSDEVRHLLDERGLVDLVGQLGDHDRHAPANLLEGDLPAYDDAAPARGVQVPDRIDPLLLPTERVPLLLESEDRAARREVRAGHDLAQVVHAHLRVVDERVDRVADLVEVVGRDVRGHSDRDAGGAVDEEVGQLRRQDGGLAQPAVVVIDEVDRLLLDVGQHLVGDRGHPCLGVAHRRGRVAVDRSEVALAVDERIAQAEVLGHADQRLVQGEVSVGVVLGHRLAHHPGALPIGGGGAQPHLVHRVQDSPMDRLQAVAHVRQRASHDDAHRVVDVRGAHLVLDRDGSDVTDAVHLHVRLGPRHCSWCRVRRVRRMCRHSPAVPGARPYLSLSSDFWDGVAPRYRPWPSAMSRPSAPRTSPATS